MRHNTALRAVKLLDAVFLTIPFGVCWYLVYADGLSEPYFQKGNWLVIALFFVLYVTYGRIYEGFRLTLSRISEMLMSQALSALIADGIMYVVTWLLTKHFPPVLPMLGVFAVQVAVAGLWCTLAHQWYFGRYKAQKTAVIYDMREGLEQLIQEYGLEMRFHVTATADVNTALEEELGILDGVEVVFLCGVHSHERNIILKQCVAKGV